LIFETEKLETFIDPQSKYLKPGWTNFIRGLFEQCLPECPVNFDSHHVKKPKSQKSQSPLLQINAHCVCDGKILVSIFIYYILFILKRLPCEI